MQEAMLWCECVSSDESCQVANDPHFLPTSYQPQPNSASQTDEPAVVVVSGNQLNGRIENQNINHYKSQNPTTTKRHKNTKTKLTYETDSTAAAAKVRRI